MSDELLTLVLVIGLLTVIVVGISMFVITKVNTEVSTGKWIVYSTSPSLEGSDNTYQVDGLQLKMEDITAVDYFYKPSGESGIIGVKLSLKNTSSKPVTIILAQSYFVNKNGVKISTEVMKGYKEFSPTPATLTLLPNQVYEVNLVAKGSQRHVVIGNVPMWVVTLLAKENSNSTITFSLPIIENGMKKFYEFKLKFVANVAK